MTDTVSIETLKMAQRDLDLCHVHLVHVGRQGFTIAHTDEERAAQEGGGLPLVACDLNVWMTGLDGPPVEPGVYIAYPHEVDAYSEPYMADPWDFEPAGDAARLTSTGPHDSDPRKEPS